MDLTKIKNELSKVLMNLSENKPTESNNELGKVWSSNDLDVSSREVGGKVEVVNVEGQKEAAPDGDYKMEDGFEFTVKDGLIVSIVGEQPMEEEMAPIAEVEQPEVEVEQPEIEMPESPEMEGVKSAIAGLDERVKAIEDALQVITENMGNKASKEDADNFSKQLSELNETLKKIAKIPTQMSKVNNADVVKNDYEKRLADLSTLFRK